MGEPEHCSSVSYYSLSRGVILLSLVPSGVSLPSVQALRPVTTESPDRWTCTFVQRQGFAPPPRTAILALHHVYGCPFSLSLNEENALFNVRPNNRSSREIKLASNGFQEEKGELLTLINRFSRI